VIAIVLRAKEKHLPCAQADAFPLGGCLKMKRKWLSREHYNMNNQNYQRRIEKNYV
jgi:hypothetical protein